MSSHFERVNVIIEFETEGALVSRKKGSGGKGFINKASRLQRRLHLHAWGSE